MVDFIGLGAQKSGTSWAYTCLYEHPEVCMPIKEIHFFSRPRYSEGVSWYESQFARCERGKKCGEWSTSYLYSDETPARIHAYYPNVKLLAILRNPVDRAYSQYRNAIRAGEIPRTRTFTEYEAQEKSVLEQGLYMKQIERYSTYFKREQMCIMIYEDIRKDPIGFMRTIHTFLGIDPNFVASMVHAEVNVARTPSVIGVDRTMHHISEFLRRNGFDRFVHAVRKTGIPDLIRRFNTRAKNEKGEGFDRTRYARYFSEDVYKLGEFLKRDLGGEWNIPKVTE